MRLASPALHRHDLEIGSEPEMIVEQASQLTDRHPMPHRDRVLPDERLESADKHRSFHGQAADGIRPIADDRLDAVLTTSRQAIRHRVDVGVNACADVLQVDDQRLDAVEHFRCWFSRFAVERVDRHPPQLVVRVRRFDHVFLEIRSEPMLRTKDGRQGGAVIRRDPVGRVDKLVIDRGWVADHADTPSVQRASGEQAFGSKLYAHAAIIPQGNLGSRERSS